MRRGEVGRGGKGSDMKRRRGRSESRLSWRERVGVRKEEDKRHNPT